MSRAAMVALLGLALTGCRDAARQPERDPPAIGNRERIVAEVLNATTGDPRRGLARAGAGYLRERGVDVVYFGSADTLVESTLVLVRRGDPARGLEVARVLGGSQVEQRPDTTLRVDVTVLLGRRWSPGPAPRP